MKSSMPNEGSKGGGSKTKSGTNTRSSHGPRKEDSQRADVLKTPTHKNPYPNGLS